MSSQLAMTLLSSAEFLLSAVLGFMFWRKGLQRRFPSMGAYLALRVASSPVLSLLLMGHLFSSQQIQTLCLDAYFFVYWAVYLVSAALLFFICMEVFRSALSSLPGLMKFGIVIFRWAAVVSLVVTFSSVSFWHRGILSIPDIAMGLMRSVSLLELCLLAFLCLSMNALRLSVRDVAFGIALGFGLMAANDFVVVSLIAGNAGLTAPLQFVYQSVVLVGLGTWVAYAALPEMARRPVVMPVNSTIYRWNEIASALGHPDTQVAVQPSNGFFLTDVEKVVEKVLNRSLKNAETES
jgi:hypothetical protein